MSQERPFGNSGAKHHPQPTEEVATTVPTPNRFWRMMTDSGFPSPASNPASFVVTPEAFLDLTTQVQALAGMVQTIVPYLPQLMHSTAHQSASPTAPSKTESQVAPNRGAPPEVENMVFSPQTRVYIFIRFIGERVRAKFFGECTPKTDHCLSPRDGPRER
ncbi:hypothetical protein BHM03_00059916 [Ensete ventricosum]|nr:hypothetical protein BHM03_00059916 [Ensete ventricosum]